METIVTSDAMQNVYTTYVTRHLVSALIVLLGFMETYVNILVQENVQVRVATLMANVIHVKVDSLEKHVHCLAMKTV